MRFWPLAENVHREGILRVSRAPAPNAPQAEAEALARALLDELDYVGVLALELFEVGGRLLANEFAPRVHNTGHWTIDGAVTSQFENHLRAILGLPLGSTAAARPRGDGQPVGGVPPLEQLLSCPALTCTSTGRSRVRGGRSGTSRSSAPAEADVDRGDRTWPKPRPPASRPRQPWFPQVRPAIVLPHDGHRRRRVFVSSIRFLPPAKIIVQPTAATAATAR